MPIETELNVRQGDLYLAHRINEHYWTADKSLAMTYTKKDVAVGLCIKMQGTHVEEIKGRVKVYPN